MNNDVFIVTWSLLSLSDHLSLLFITLVIFLNSLSVHIELMNVYFWQVCQHFSAHVQEFIEVT